MSGWLIKENTRQSRSRSNYEAFSRYGTLTTCPIWRRLGFGLAGQELLIDRYLCLIEMNWLFLFARFGLADVFSSTSFIEPIERGCKSSVSLRYDPGFILSLPNHWAIVCLVARCSLAPLIDFINGGAAIARLLKQMLFCNMRQGLQTWQTFAHWGCLSQSQSLLQVKRQSR